jgi:perosamine synthetase
MTNLQAALGVGQIRRMDQIVARKREIAFNYNQLLKDIVGLELPIEELWARNVYWVYGVVLQERTGISASRFAERLKEYGVETRPFFLGMHEQPVFRKIGLFEGEHYPVSERLAKQGLYIPSGLAVSLEQQKQVAQALKECLL